MPQKELAAKPVGKSTRVLSARMWGKLKALEILPFDKKKHRTTFII